MTTQDHDIFKNKLDAFSRRLDERIREFKERGEFSDIHESHAAEMRNQQRALQQKVDTAAASGTTWELVKDELERDFDALAEAFALFEERLDAQSMKERNPKSGS